ncbi:MAG: ImmA/IrrE family metallo-endopeptidase [Acidimicrobiia bacterium]|nr:ImmA/IrrE family metallo-endopeptidase [Acidimicrobiia bacterium]
MSDDGPEAGVGCEDKLTVRSETRIEGVEAAARRVAPVFSGPRLVALRELCGMTQAAVAGEAGITASALSQAERGHTALSARNIAKVARFFQVTPDALAERREADLEMKPQFRHLRRTSVREQRKAERFVLATARVAAILRDRVEFPEPFTFTHPINPLFGIQDVAEEVERAAELTRSELGLPRNEPIGSRLIGQLEAGGVTVVRDPETDRDIDAYSAVVGRLPVIVLDGGEGSVWDRDNFNLAHELGHLVMHRGIAHTPGTRTVEAQAHRFAGAFLGPAEALRKVLPRRLDWNRYLELKREWGMSMAALIRRAKDLGVINDAMYTRAMKQQSSYGWRKVEPGSTDRLLPVPRFMPHAMSRAEISTPHLSKRAHLPEDVVLRIVGERKPSLTVGLAS